MRFRPIQGKQNAKPVVRRLSCEIEILFFTLSRLPTRRPATVVSFHTVLLPVRGLESVRVFASLLRVPINHAIRLSCCSGLQVVVVEWI